MKLIVNPGNALNGLAQAPGDKSLSHRAALFAAIAVGESRIDNFLKSGVTDAMLGALTALGISWNLQEKILIVQGQGLHGFHHPVAPINCGNSATTLRLLAGALIAGEAEAILDGSPGLRHRPMDRIIHPLQQMGATISSTGGYPPLILKKSSLPLLAIDWTLPVASAQLKSCLLLAALAGSGDTTLREPGLSRDHSERMLQSMGVKIEQHREITGDQVAYITKIAPPMKLAPLKITLPGDMSSAAFLIVAALITPGSEITITGVGLNPTRTGLIDALQIMGADIKLVYTPNSGSEPCGDITIRHSKLHATCVEGELVVRMIDEFPAFAIAAAYASGSTVVADAQELRVKESDRISTLCQELQGIGINAVEAPDGFTIHGGTPVSGGTAHPHGDHRLAMALALAGLAARQPVIVEQAGIIDESFPEFFPTLQCLGANLEQQP